MGYYINTNSKGEPLRPLGKAKALVDDGATIVDGKEFQPNLICIVSNGMFDAAGFAFSLSEYEAFKEPDGRQRTWLIHPQAAKLAGYERS